ncbi:MAG TPA: hypothetical protein VFA08_07920 [Actinomycetota bacterium]|jgi:hypothetical protein|nr:hypothetical protein [Actinomycetota bacterium]
MQELPQVLATSVVRSTQQGESHGGVYLVDLSTGDRELLKDWDDPSINWEGRGADRGLRGIAFYDELILLAASDELFIYDRSFNIVDSYRNAYLKHCHEIHRENETLWLTSTGFDCVLGFDLRAGRFSIAYHFVAAYPNRGVKRLPAYSARAFDPRQSDGPHIGDSIHLNAVWTHEGVLLSSGTQLRHILAIVDSQVRTFARIPRGTHNARPFRDGILVNHTATNRLAFLSRRGRVRKSFPIKIYPDWELTHASLSADHARQAFGRGLCTWSDRVVIGGSSPATVSAFDFDTGELLTRVNLTMDVRNAIHGLEVWPF